MSKRTNVRIKTSIYKTFKGVDFTTDPSLVDKSRSPMATNMISDEGGNPEKRPGYKRVCDFGSGKRVYGLYRAEFSGVQHYLAHVENKLCKWNPEAGTYTEFGVTFPLNKSSAVFMNGKLYIFTGNGLYTYDGTTVQLASVGAYVPLIKIGCQAGSTPGGVTYEGINYLSNQVRVSFLAVLNEALYKLPYTNITSVDEVKVNGNTESASNYTVDLTNGTVTFVTGHIPSPPAAGAADNVEIKFTRTFAGYSDRINKCTTAIAWGVEGASDRIVASGDPAYPNRDYISGYLDGSYWSDTNYQIVGSDATKIIGYRRSGSTLAIIKEDNGQDSTIFLRTGSLDDSGEAKWATYPCIAGVGGVSRFGFGNINDDQLILTGSGVYALTSNTITAQKIAENRSIRINPKMVKEDLSSAICASFRNLMMVFVNSHVYILDGKQAKTYENRNDTTFTYECYYWEDVPANCLMVTTDDGNEQLYFGTTDGKIMQFMFDELTVYKYSDGGYVNNGAWVSGSAIECEWATKADDDGDPMVYKTLLKKGNAVTLKPYKRSSAKVCFRTDKDAIDWQANTGAIDIFDWTDIDFSRFTFNANDSPREIPFNRKVKNYKRLQIIIRNDGLNEGFGVYGITKHYVTGNFAKR